MLISMEYRKLKSTGFVPAFLAGGLLAALIPAINTGARPDTFTSLPGDPLSILLNANAQMILLLQMILVVCGACIMYHTEYADRALRHMLALPLRPSAMCLCKFIVLLVLAFLQTALMTGLYFVSAGIASSSTGVSLMAEPSEVFALAGLLFLSALPMLAVYWMLAVCLQTPVFSITAGLASMVPTVLMINTKVWYLYPPCYPFYIVTWKYGEFAGSTPEAPDLFPWIPAAAGIALICIIISCLLFGQAERR